VLHTGAFIHRLKPSTGQIEAAMLLPLLLLLLLLLRAQAGSPRMQLT